MAELVNGNFAADGSTVAVKAGKFTILMGDATATNFGGGTVTAEVSHDGVLFTTAHSFTEEGVQASVDYTGGVVIKLTLTGSTSPALNYSMKYE